MCVQTVVRGRLLDNKKALFTRGCSEVFRWIDFIGKETVLSELSLSKATAQRVDSVSNSSLYLQDITLGQGLRSYDAHLEDLEQIGFKLPNSDLYVRVELKYFVADHLAAW